MIELHRRDLPPVDLDAFEQGGPAARIEQRDRARAMLEHTNLLAYRDSRLSADVLTRAGQLARELFALPRATKLGHARRERGYMPQGIEQALGGRVPDLKEMWHIGPRAMPPALAPYALHYRPNVWPPELPELRPCFEDLYARFERSTATVLGLLAETLELPAAALASLAEGASHTLRLLHYPPLPDDRPAEQERAAAHTGAGLLGILPPASEAGLEVCRRDGTWQALRGFDDCMVVTIADMMPRLTADRIPASLHRVRNPTGEAARRARHALVFFALARPDTALVPLPGLLAPGERSPHEPMSASAFVLQRMNVVWDGQRRGRAFT